MASVGTENEIFRRQRKGHSHRGRFLSDRQMRGSCVVIRNALVGALGLDFIQDGFELPDRAHVPPHMQEIFGGVIAQFLLQRAVVGIDGDVGQMDLRLGKNLSRFNNDRFRHSLKLL